MDASVRAESRASKERSSTPKPGANRTSVAPANPETSRITIARAISQPGDPLDIALYTITTGTQQHNVIKITKSCPNEGIFPHILGIYTRMIVIKQTEL